MNITRQTSGLLILLFILAACNGMKVTETLGQIDSLINREQYDSAYVLLNTLDKKTMTTEEQAHYNLLSTQLGYLTDHPLSTDSLLNSATTYYRKVKNYQKLANAYYYKSRRFEINHDYTQAILYAKKAEQLAMTTDDAHLQFKIIESLAYLNGLCENDAFQLLYAKKALAIAKMENNKNWIAYAYNLISFAFENLNQHDSACFYIEKTIPYIDYVFESDRAGFLTNLGLLYKDNNPQRAKELFEKALTYNELPETMEHLADVFYSMGNKEDAYRLWKKALTRNSRYDKINLIHSIISYDLEHGNIDEVSKNVDEIINIKDSILNKLKNDTIKDLQLRFDHEVAMHEADTKLGRSQMFLMGLTIALIMMVFYFYYRSKKTKTKEKNYQDRLYAYTTEINQLTVKRENALKQIGEMRNHMDKDSQKIEKLEKEIRKSELAIEEFNRNIKKLLDDKAPKLKQGRMLYDHIMEGGTASLWTSKDEALFNDYYASINYHIYNRLKNIERATKPNAHNMFYLILKEMGKDDTEIMRILNISREGLRSLRSRTKPIDQHSS